MNLEQRIRRLSESRPLERSEENWATLAELRLAMNQGAVRAAEPDGEVWRLNSWVKQGIALHSVLGVVKDTSASGKGQHFEMNTFPLRTFGIQDQVRIPPGGSWIRDGCYLAPGVHCMPPAVVNMGVHIGRSTVIDSHANVGLCAQIGERAHVGSGAQVGGVIAPLERFPTIVGDDVLICGNCGIYDGVRIGAGAILAAGTLLTGNSTVYDLKRDRIYRHQGNEGLHIPARAVVTMGASPIRTGMGARLGLTMAVPMIVGYRDDPGFSENSIRELLDQATGSFHE